MTTSGDLPYGGTFIGGNEGYAQAIELDLQQGLERWTQMGQSVLTACGMAAGGQLGVPQEAVRTIDSYTITQRLPAYKVQGTRAEALGSLHEQVPYGPPPSPPPNPGTRHITFID